MVDFVYEYWDVIVSLLLIAYLFLPHVWKETVNILLMQAFVAITDLVRTVNVILALTVFVGHWIGRVFVILIFLAAIAAIGRKVSIIFGHDLFGMSERVMQIVGLFADQSAWVAATAIVATTVALGHFRTLDLNLEKYSAEQREKLEQRIKARREKRSNA